MSIQQFYLDNYDRYKQRGLGSQRRGDTADARWSFLKASQMMYKLAAISPPPLAEACKQRAGRMLALAESIDTSAGASLDTDVMPGQTDQRSERSNSADRGDAWQVTELPELGLDDVVGLQAVKERIRRRVIYPVQHPEVAKRYGKQAGGGVLLYGPPGTGKTMLARAIANAAGCPFFSVRCSDLLSKWVGESEQNIKALFDAAGQRDRAVVFMDETEALLPRRGHDNPVMNRVIPEFLSQVDGLGGRREGLLLLGATNRPWDMDEAALRPGRFGELIYVPLPDVDARRALIADCLAGLPLGEDVDIDQFAELSAGMSGADVVGCCELVKDGPFGREISTGTLQRIESTDIQQALAASRRSVSESMLGDYVAFAEGRAT